uniref:Methyltransferase type 11 n=1 Tax=Ochrobactrum sp. PW1 TaxID=1882222 RepID=A0A292GQC6_9HYPH|nr:methyltransferase type 11 [Ochrobactrum sp. PW1]
MEIQERYFRLMQDNSSDWVDKTDEHRLAEWRHTMLGCFSQDSVAFGYGRCLTGIGTNHCLIEASRTLGTRLLFVASRLLEEPNSNEALAQFEGQACPSVTYAIAYRTSKPANGLIDALAQAGLRLA